MREPPVPTIRAKMVGWYDAGVLAQSAWMMTIANLFGRHSDTRLIEALSNQPQGVFRFEPDAPDGDFWFDFVSDVGDGFNPTYTVARAFGSRAGLADPVGLPVLLFVISVFGVLAQPVLNTLSRMDETESDVYSLRTVNLPDALASALVKTAEYRNPRPGALQEIAFYTHPSVERRVRRAMEWKAQHGGGG